ncbi:MAG: GNAT family N-acetyltransferase [Bacteroidetes bacterium]|nr:GNAT family N-acetyltransferase [Bacteroidota bacterium]
MIIRKATLEDAPGILALYKATAAIPGGLARTPDEITEAYIAHNLNQALATGVCLVVAGNLDIMAEIHCYKLAPAVFKHVLGELTIAVHPDFQGKGWGRRIFEAMLLEIQTQKPEIRRVELICRESNTKAIALYESLGFRQEGRLEGRIESVNGGVEADIFMGWSR